MLEFVADGPRREGEEPKPMMHDHEKSDSVIVAWNPTNKVEQSAAEPEERRTETKRNTVECNTRRTQSRECVSQALARVRQAARDYQIFCVWVGD